MVFYKERRAVGLLLNWRVPRSQQSEKLNVIAD